MWRAGAEGHFQYQSPEAQGPKEAPGVKVGLLVFGHRYWIAEQRRGDVFANAGHSEPGDGSESLSLGECQGSLVLSAPLSSPADCPGGGYSGLHPMDGTAN